MLVTVSDPTAGVAAGGAVRRRVQPVTADGHRAFWRRPTSLLAESARAYLAALAAHLQGHVLPQLEFAQADLAGHGLDEHTLRQLAGARQLLAAAAATLTDLGAAGRRRRTGAYPDAHSDAHSDAQPTEAGARR